MSVKVVLSLILLILMILIGGKRGIKSFFTLYINLIIVFIVIIFISYNFNPMFVTIIGCCVIGCISLFFINGINKKTISAFISVIIVVLLMIILVYIVGQNSKIQGFSDEEFDSISPYSLYIHTDFIKTTICVILMGLIGAIVDVAISIASSINELYLHNSRLSFKELYKSGINIGKDILGTTTNTLYFAFIGSFMALIIWLNELNYSLSQTINSKVFASEIIQILCCGIGTVLIIPITSYVSSKILSMKK